MRAEAEGKAKEELENLEFALKDAHQKVKDFADTPTEDLFKEEEEEFFKEEGMPLVLATEFAAEPEPETNDATYYGIGAAAFSTIAAAAYLYRKRQTAKG